MSLLHPYSAARRVACPGSRALEALYPVADSDYQTEGRLAHKWAAHKLKTLLLSDEQYYSNFDDPIERNSLTPEMISGADFYCGYIHSIWLDLGSPQVFIEHKINIHSIHPECSGTPDFFMYAKNELHIIDYKFGHRPVEAYENWQLIEYAAGIIDFLGCDTLDLKVHLHIVQPRAIHQFNSWVMSVDDTRMYFYTLRKAESKSMESDALCYATPECQLCLARHACPTLQRSALSAIEISYLNVPDELSPNEIGNQLRLLKHAATLLDARISGLSEQALSLIKSGKRVSHFTAIASAGRERWKSSITEVLLLGQMLGFDLSKPQEAITPKQAIKLGLSESVIKSYSETLTGALKLVESNSVSKKVFSN